MRFILIIDNYVIHKGHAIRNWLARHPKFQLVFQPGYRPWVNTIKRLWKPLPDTVARNHQHATLNSLTAYLRPFMRAAPFPRAVMG